MDIKKVREYMKICFVKQDVYQDLYVGDNKLQSKQLLFTSMMRVVPYALIDDLSGDFYIIKEENTEECQIYNHFLRGFGGNYKKLKTDLLNNIPGNHFFEPGMNEMLSKVENYIKDRTANS